ncbi:MAG: hypothetical protein M3069_16915 [Chloroflexota bacterium]|nr:hypothetical protein [Chloroflexota bacterium]
MRSTPTPTWPPNVNPATNPNDPAYVQDVRRRLVDARLRIEDMDGCGIELTVLSLNQPGVQAIPRAAMAIETARRVKDELAERFVAAYPTRFAGFASIRFRTFALPATNSSARSPNSVSKAP